MMCSPNQTKKQNKETQTKNPNQMKQKNPQKKKNQNPQTKNTQPNPTQRNKKIRKLEDHTSLTFLKKKNTVENGFKLLSYDVTRSSGWCVERY